MAIALFGMSLCADGCNRNSEGWTSFWSSSKADCLPDLMLTDQYGKKISLASLKGKPVLFDFFYTTCPGPCLMLTARMRRIAADLGARLGSGIVFVSITVDPEHDSPSQLLDYAREQGANLPGWIFLTGPPAQIDRAMSNFGLERERDSDGSIAHVLEFFLVGRDGHLQYQYLANEVDPARIASDLENALGGSKVASHDALGARGA